MSDKPNLRFNPKAYFLIKYINYCMDKTKTDFFVCFGLVELVIDIHTDI